MSPQPTSIKQAGARRSPWVFVPPPPLFVLSFVAGMQMARVAPLPLAVPAISPVTRALGFTLVAAAVLVLASAVALFAWRRTTIVPHASARSLVNKGPYRVTRNPMYLGLVVGYVGVALALNAFWPLPFLALPLWVLQTRVIPFEERTMAHAFGDEYRAYQRAVGRWLTLAPRE